MKYKKKGLFVWITKCQPSRKQPTHHASFMSGAVQHAGQIILNNKQINISTGVEIYQNGSALMSLWAMEDETLNSRSLLHF